MANFMWLFYEFLVCCFVPIITFLEYTTQCLKVTKNVSLRGAIGCVTDSFLRANVARFARNVVKWDFCVISNHCEWVSQGFWKLILSKQSQNNLMRNQSSGSTYNYVLLEYLPMATMAMEERKTGVPWHECANWHNHCKSLPNIHFRLDFKKSWKRSQDR